MLAHIKVQCLDPSLSFTTQTPEDVMRDKIIAALVIWFVVDMLMLAANMAEASHHVWALFMGCGIGLVWIDNDNNKRED